MATKPVQKMVIQDGEDAYTIYSPFKEASEFNAFSNGISGTYETKEHAASELSALHSTITGETATQITAITSKKGSANGYASLDSAGKVPASQLPSYVDDVEEYLSLNSFPNTGETGKIYVDKTANKTYRWSGSAYTEISASLALGETSSTAYRGDYGKAAYDHAQAKGSAFTSGLYKITVNAQGHVTAAVLVTKADLTALGLVGSEIIDDTTGDGTTNKTWSADKIADEMTSLSGAVTSALALKAPLADPVFTGVPKIGTKVIATKEYMDNAVAELIDDTAANTIQYRTWSAAKTDQEIKRQIIENIDAIADKSGKFEIVKTFASTYEMNTYDGSDVANGDFVMIASSDQNNGKTYMKTDGGYVYINNFSNFSSLINAEGISDAEIDLLFADL